MESTYFKIPFPRPHAKQRICFFPHAGGSAVNFYRLAKLVPEDIEVLLTELPGRGFREHEPLPTSILAAAQELASSLVSKLDKPLSFFGHSMGAIVAFETNQVLLKQTEQGCRHFFASAARPPKAAWATRNRYLFDNDQQIIDRMRKLGGTPDALLEDPDWLLRILPPFRTDFSLLANYNYTINGPRHTPITVIGGYDDSEVTRDDLIQWREETTTDFNLHMVSGDHFYLFSQPDKTIELILSYQSTGNSSY